MKSDEGKERKRIIAGFDPHQLAWLEVIQRLPGIQRMPDSEEEIERWLEEYPDEAKQLEDTLVRITQEFSSPIKPSKEQEPE